MKSEGKTPVSREVVLCLKEMLYELEDNHLSVVLIPQKEPLNHGACLRKACSHNAEWYQEFCGRHESNRKRIYRNFKTKIKRRETIRMLNRLIEKGNSESKYAEELIEFAQDRAEEYEKMQKAE